MIFAGGFDLVELCLSSGNIFRFLIMFDVRVECPFMAAGVSSGAFSGLPAA